MVASISLFGSFQLYSASRNIAGRESVAVLFCLGRRMILAAVCLSCFSLFYACSEVFVR